MKWFFSIFFVLINTICFANTTLTGNLLTGNYNTHLFTFKGNVHYNSESLMLTAGELFFFQAQKKMVAKTKVVLTLIKDGTVISGETLEKVKGNILVGSIKNIPVKVVEKSGRTLTCGTLTAKEINNSIVQSICAGEPKIQSPDMNVSSEKITYSPKAKLILLGGSTTIVQTKEGQTIRSQNIKVDDAKKVITFLYPVTFVDTNQNYLAANKGTYNTTLDVLTLQNKVNYRTTNASIFSDFLNTKKIDKDTNYIFTKNITITYRDFKGKSDTVLYNKNKKILTLSQNVDLKNSKTGLIINCSTMDVHEKEKKSYLYKNVKLTLGTKILQGNIGVYDDVTKIFTVKGNATYTDKGNVYTARVITLNNKDLEVKMQGDVTGKSVLNTLQGVRVEKNEE